MARTPGITFPCRLEMIAHPEDRAHVTAEHGGRRFYLEGFASLVEAEKLATALAAKHEGKGAAFFILDRAGSGSHSISGNGAEFARIMAALPAITLECPLSPSSGAFSAHWNDPRTGSRCHVWIRLVDRGPDLGVGRVIEPVIYVNPAFQADGKPVPTTSPDYFDTRKRDLDAKANAVIRDEIRRIARPAILQGLADAKRLEEVRTMKAHHAEARAKRLRDAVATIQGATFDELAAAMLEASTETAAFAERLRTARPDTVGERHPTNATERRHGFEVVQAEPSGRVSLLRFVRVTKARPADAAYQEAERIADESRALAHRPHVTVREINAPVHT